MARITTHHRIRNPTHPQSRSLESHMAIIKKYHPLTIWDIEASLASSSSSPPLSPPSSLRKSSTASQDSHPDTEGMHPGVELVVDHSSPISIPSSSPSSRPRQCYKDGCESCESIERQCALRDRHVDRDVKGSSSSNSSSSSRIEELDRKRNALADIHWEEQD